MSNQTPEHWHNGSVDMSPSPEQAEIPYQRIVNDPVQREAVRRAMFARADVDPRIVRAMGFAVESTVATQGITAIDAVPCVPYSGTEGAPDVPAQVVVPNGFRAHLPA